MLQVIKHQRTPSVIIWLSVLMSVLLTACSPGDPKPVLHPVYATSAQLEKNGTPASGLVVEVMSPLNCVDRNDDVWIYLTVTNITAEPITQNQQLDLRIEERIRGETMAYYWSEAPGYPSDIPTVFQPRETRRYIWRWQPPVMANESIPQSQPYEREIEIWSILRSTQEAQTHNEYINRVTIYLGAMPWGVGGSAGIIPISCPDVMLNTIQIAATATAEAQ